jgi:hypothetical protein
LISLEYIAEDRAGKSPGTLRHWVLCKTTLAQTMTVHLGFNVHLLQDYGFMEHQLFDQARDLTSICLSAKFEKEGYFSWGTRGNNLLTGKHNFQPNFEVCHQLWPTSEKASGQRLHARATWFIRGASEIWGHCH